MLFILTNSQDATASFLIPALEKSRLPFVRFDTDQVLRNLAFEFRAGTPALRVNNAWFTPDEIDHIWYRRPEHLMHEQFDDSPEGKYARGEWTEFIENFFAHVAAHKWLNHPSSNAAASRKIEQLTTAAALGIRVPDTLVTQEPEKLRAFYAKHHGRVIAKPISTGYVARGNDEIDSLIYTTALKPTDLSDLSDLSVCPTLFQEFIDKAYDVRITVVDSKMTAVTLVAKEPDGTQRCDIRRDNMTDVTYSPIDLPDEATRAISMLMANYRLRFAAIDMVVAQSGDWHFLEINPNGQWAWLDTVAGTNITETFVRVFSENLHTR